MAIRHATRWGMVLILLAASAQAQEQGGVTLTFGLDNRVETTRNPTLTPGNDDLRTVLSTDLSATLASVTRQSRIALSAGGRLRYAFGDGAEGDKGARFGRQTLHFSYGTRSARATLEADVRFLHDDVSFLQNATLEGAGISDAGDLTDLQGTGTRQSLSYRLSAEVDADAAVGWGVTVSGTDLRYSDVTNADLEDSLTFNAALTGHATLSPALRLTGRLGYAHRDSDGAASAGTTTLALGLVAAQSDTVSLRGHIAYADPDTSDARLAVTAGVAFAPTRLSTLSIDLGASISDGYDTRLIGRVAYDLRTSRHTRLHLRAQSEVTDDADSNVVVNSVAQAGFDTALTHLTSLSFDASFAEEDDLTTGITTANSSARLQLNRALSKDWTLSMGLRHTTRRQTGNGSAASQVFFVNIGRRWQGRF